MTRLSTGYTFLNIQEHSKFIKNNIEKIENLKIYHIGKNISFLIKFFKCIKIIQTKCLKFF